MIDLEVMKCLNQEVNNNSDENVTVIVNTNIFSLKDVCKARNILIRNENGIEIHISSDDNSDEKDYIISDFTDCTRIYDEAYDISSYSFFKNGTNDSVTLNFL